MVVPYSPEVAEILSKATAPVSALEVIFGIGHRQAYEAVNRGEIPSIRLGRRIVISTRVIQEILDAGTIPERAA
ncbi:MULTISPECIES: helix-turn-helix domain-containing protein [Arthrobacter]|uniref:DNA-binding protein n=1 Tax=Arthrobacter terricola TaxID=2547396 RepID=A0A4R5K4P5_9MICC|nr:MULTISPECIES: helix-turn-helix domain-containing protein [Arthrobacter]MBT8159312.1 helix-turn-helix domain-containing protein [Arthrobacter sp. GN70]TDF86871.1 DNA-binding protein [Arthrobacter terricola]